MSSLARIIYSSALAVSGFANLVRLSSCLQYLETEFFILRGLSFTCDSIRLADVYSRNFDLSAATKSASRPCRIAFGNVCIGAFR